MGKSLTLQDYWNIVGRGFAPHGLNRNPPKQKQHDAETFSEDDPKEDVVPADKPHSMNAQPVVIVDDITADYREKYIVTSLSVVGTTSSDIIASRNSDRTQLIVQNLGPGVICLGHNESVGVTGFPLAVNQLIVLSTTRDVWAIQMLTEPPVEDMAVISVLQEYDKDVVS